MKDYYITDLIFFPAFKRNSGFYRYDSFFIVYSILPLADVRFFFVGFVKSGLYISICYISCKQAVLRSKCRDWLAQNQYNVSKSGLSIEAGSQRFSPFI